MMASGNARLELVREDDILTLQFGDSIQSRMLASDPSYLVLTYTRAMAAFTLFCSDPEHIVMIGLGGGSLAKWCRQSFPLARIQVIEIEQDVIDLRLMFCVPPDDSHFQVVLGDGSKYVELTHERPNVLLVDGFESSGDVSPQTCTQAFYDNCFRTLSDDGVLVVNVASQDDEPIFRLRNSFSNRVVLVQPADGVNRIAFAVKGKRRPAEDESVDSLKRRFETEFTHIETLVVR